MNRERLKKQLIWQESLKLKTYRCTAGKLTIGVGRNLDDNGISEVEAMFLLDNDLNSVEKDLDYSIPWWRKLDDARQEVIANMAFNMGIKVFLGFKQTLAAVQAGQYKDASVLMLDSKWAKQVGNRATVLSKQLETGVAR